jgi:hypothetical protein
MAHRIRCVCKWMWSLPNNIWKGIRGMLCFPCAYQTHPISGLRNLCSPLSLSLSLSLIHSLTRTCTSCLNLQRRRC